MPPSSPRLRILSVGGNAVSAFLSWRLQATNACDVTLVWKTGFETVSQYGITFSSETFGNERFKPRQVVQSPDEAAHIAGRGSFDYVLLCVKALPDVYDLASVIESVVTPQHTCILINTSHSLGVERAIEERFPKNVVLSLVSNADFTQIGPAEFEHSGSSELWVGPANWNAEIPVSIQSDMAEALSMTLASGQVDCKVSKNIQHQQFERMIGPIAFHTTSVLFETPNHADLLQLAGVRTLISDTIDEMLRVAAARGCSFPLSFKESTMEDMIMPKNTNSVMYQDYAAKRPMEVETYLGAPMRIAAEENVNIPRIQTLYALLHHVNIANQKRPGPIGDMSGSQHIPNLQPRMSSMPQPRPYPPNGQMPMRPGNGMGPGANGRGSRAPSMSGAPQGMMRRGPPPTGYGPGGNGAMSPRGSGPLQRDPSFEQPGDALDEFSHVVLLDEYGDGGAAFEENPSPASLALRERDLMLRQKELALREREMHMRSSRGGYGGGRGRPAASHYGGDEEDDDGEDYFDPMAYRGPPVDPDQVDMMSITSRRTRKQPSAGQLRQNPEMGGRGRGNPFRPGMGRNRASSSRAIMDMSSPNPHESLTDNPLFGYTDNRYGSVDRASMGQQSRTNSLTAARLDELTQGNGYGGYPPMGARRASQSPGQPLAPAARRPMMNGGYPSNGISPNGIPGGRPSPPDMRQPVPRHPPGHGNAVAPQGIEQRAGVSNLYPPKSGPQVRSLTGSASASAGSGDSNRSAQIESENSAYSSQSSLGPRGPIGVR